MKTQRQPAQPPIEAIMNGFRGTQILVTAVRLGVFAALATGPRSAAVLAHELRCDPRGVRILCDALVVLGLLAKRGETYRNTPAATAALLPATPDSQCDMILHLGRLYESWGGLVRAVRTGRPVPERCLGRHWHQGESDAAFARAMAVAGRQQALETAAAVNLRGARTMLDAGGGPGLYAMAFARRNPGLTVTLLDTAATLREAGRSIRAARLEGRINLRPGNLLRGDLGRGYDFILISNVVHVFAPAENRRVIRKLAAALRPGGRLGVKDFIVNETRTGPANAVLFAVNMLVNADGGDTYTAGEVRAWFRAVGLVPDRGIVLPPFSTLLLARRPGRG